MSRIFFFITLLIATSVVHSQSAADTIIKNDSSAIFLKSVGPSPKKIQHVKHDTAEAYFSGVKYPGISAFILQFNINDTFIYTDHPYFHFTDPVHPTISVKRWNGKEPMFYSLIVLLIFFGLIRNGFSKYIADLFRIFFRTTVKQRQIKEQLVQSPIPSLLLNLYFLLSGGMFLALMLQYFGLGLIYNFWILFLYCIAGLVGIYGMKFIWLKIFGWVFRLSDAMESYIFIVFSTNKIIGILLLPFLVVISLTSGITSQVAWTLSITFLLALIIYRCFLSYWTVNRLTSINFFHFILYIFAFEIVPLLLINKLLFRYL